MKIEFRTPSKLTVLNILLAISLALLAAGAYRTFAVQRDLVALHQKANVDQAVTRLTTIELCLRGHLATTGDLCRLASTWPEYRQLVASRPSQVAQAPPAEEPLVSEEVPEP